MKLVQKIYWAVLAVIYREIRNKVDWLPVCRYATITISLLKWVQFKNSWHIELKKISVEARWQTQRTWNLPQMKSHPQPELCIFWLNMLQQQQEYLWDNCLHLEPESGALDCPIPASSTLGHSWLDCQLSGRSGSDILSTSHVRSPERKKVNFSLFSDLG